jgi:Mlc titration factor MtfA (ptsG expression regulator)
MIGKWFRSHNSTRIPDALWNPTVARRRCISRLPANDRERLRDLTFRFLSQKTFEGAAGLAVTETMRVDIAAQACLLILNLEFDYYAGWQAIIVYPGDFVVSREFEDDDGVVHQWTEEVAGEAWEYGPVLLSWDASRMEGDDINVVLHEFAHKLDMRDGSANGCPPLPTEVSPSEWARDFQEAYDVHSRAVSENTSGWLDEYAAESPAEFFAVLSEMFFVQPSAVRRDFPAVYRQLKSFYQQDPAALLHPFAE